MIKLGKEARGWKWGYNSIDTILKKRYGDKFIEFIK